MAKFKTKFTPKEIAIVSLSKYKTEIESDPNLHQVTFNIVTDKLRIYLGESSKIYISFAAIDISIPDGHKQERMKNAVKLIEAAINIIESNGIYEDLQLQLLRLNMKSMKNKTKIAFWSTIGGSILTLIATYARDIGKVVLKLLHLPEP